MGKFIPCVINEEGYILTQERSDLKERYVMYCEALDYLKKYFLGKNYKETDKHKIISDIKAIIKPEYEKLTASGKDAKKRSMLINAECNINTIEGEIFLIEKSIKRYDENFQRSIAAAYVSQVDAINEIAKLLNNTFGSISSDMLDDADEQTKVSLDYYNMLNGEHRQTLNLAFARNFVDSAERAFKQQVKEKQNNCEHNFSVPVYKTVVEFESVDPTDYMDHRGKYFTKRINTCMCEKCGFIQTTVLDIQETPVFYPGLFAKTILEDSRELCRTRKNRN